MIMIFSEDRELIYVMSKLFSLCSVMLCPSIVIWSDTVFVVSPFNQFVTVNN